MFLTTAKCKKEVEAQIGKCAIPISNKVNFQDSGGLFSTLKVLFLLHYKQGIRMHQVVIGILHCSAAERQLLSKMYTEQHKNMDDITFVELPHFLSGTFVS